MLTGSGKRIMNAKGRFRSMNKIKKYFAQALSSNVKAGPSDPDSSQLGDSGWKKMGLCQKPPQN